MLAEYSIVQHPCQRSQTHIAIEPQATLETLACNDLFWLEKIYWQFTDKRRQVRSQSYEHLNQLVMIASKLTRQTVLQLNFRALEILTDSIVLNGFWKQSSLATTSVTSALEVIFNEMRYTNLRFTYLLTYLHISINNIIVQ